MHYTLVPNMMLPLVANRQKHHVVSAYFMILVQFTTLAVGILRKVLWDQRDPSLTPESRNCIRSECSISRESMAPLCM